MAKLSASDLFITVGKVPSARVHGTVRALNAEPYGVATDLPAGCIDVDHDFENFAFVIRYATKRQIAQTAAAVHHSMIHTCHSKFSRDTTGHE